MRQAPERAHSESPLSQSMCADFSEIEGVVTDQISQKYGHLDGRKPFTSPGYRLATLMGSESHSLRPSSPLTSSPSLAWAAARP